MQWAVAWKIARLSFQNWLVSVFAGLELLLARPSAFMVCRLTSQHMIGSFFASREPMSWARRPVIPFGTVVHASSNGTSRAFGSTSTGRASSAISGVMLNTLTVPGPAGICRESLAALESPTRTWKKVVRRSGGPDCLTLPLGQKWRGAEINRAASLSDRACDSAAMLIQQVRGCFAFR